MPNWTENTLVVQATTKKEIDDFIRKSALFKSN